MRQKNALPVPDAAIRLAAERVAQIKQYARMGFESENSPEIMADLDALESWLAELYGNKEEDPTGNGRVVLKPQALGSFWREGRTSDGVYAFQACVALNDTLDGIQGTRVVKLIVVRAADIPKSGWASNYNVMRCDAAQWVVAPQSVEELALYSTLVAELERRSTAPA